MFFIFLALSCTAHSAQGALNSSPLVLNGTSYSTTNACPLGQLSDFSHNISLQVTTKITNVIVTLQQWATEANQNMYENQSYCVISQQQVHNLIATMVTSVSADFFLLTNVYSLSSKKETRALLYSKKLKLFQADQDTTRELFYSRKFTLLQEDGGEDEEGDEGEGGGFGGGDGGEESNDGEEESPGNGEPGFTEEDGEDVYVSSSGVAISSSATYGCGVGWSSCYVSYIIIYDDQGNPQQVQVTSECLLQKATETLTYVIQRLQNSLTSILAFVSNINNLTNTTIGKCTNETNETMISPDFLLQTVEKLKQVQSSVSSSLDNVFGVSNHAFLNSASNQAVYLGIGILLFLLLVCK